MIASFLTKILALPIYLRQNRLVKFRMPMNRDMFVDDIMMAGGDEVAAGII